MSWDGICESVCPVARSLSIVGDRWTLLILRELSMGSYRFDDLQAQTGMSPHLLSTRLKRLEKDGVIERWLYNERPPRYGYHATQKGRELDPVLMLLRSWGRKWEGDLPDGEPAVKLVEKKTGKVIDHMSQLPGKAEAFRFDRLEATINPAFRAERAANLDAFLDGTTKRAKTKPPVKAEARKPVTKKTITRPISPKPKATRKTARAAAR